MLHDTLADGRDSTFAPIRYVVLDNSRLALYRTDMGATTSWGLVLRQETELLPGLLLVREVYNNYRARDADVTLVSPTEVRIICQSGWEDRRDVMVTLKPHVYF